MLSKFQVVDAVQSNRERERRLLPWHQPHQQQEQQLHNNKRSRKDGYVVRSSELDHCAVLCSPPTGISPRRQSPPPSPSAVVVVGRRARSNCVTAGFRDVDDFTYYVTRHRCRGSSSSAVTATRTAASLPGSHPVWRANEGRKEGSRPGCQLLDDRFGRQTSLPASICLSVRLSSGYRP